MVETECNGYDCCPLQPEINRLREQLDEAERNLFISWDIIKHGVQTAEQAAYVMEIPTRPKTPANKAPPG